MTPSKAAIEAARKLRVKIHGFSSDSSTGGIGNPSNSRWLDGMSINDAPIIQTACEQYHEEQSRWIPVEERPKEKGIYFTAARITGQWIFDKSEWDGRYFRSTDKFNEILTVHFYMVIQQPPQAQGGKE